MPELVLHRLQSRLLEPVDLAIGATEVVALHGPSGSGKTVFLRAIADLDPNAGDVSLDGHNRNTMAPCEWRRRVGFLPAESAWWHDRVGDHLPQWTCSCLEALGFERDVLDWECSRLSSGERQRLGLARLLSCGPEALLLDEPTANLDDHNVGKVEALIRGFQKDRKTPILWVSHDPEQRQRIARVSCAIEHGRLQCH